MAIRPNLDTLTFPEDRQSAAAHAVSLAVALEAARPLSEVQRYGLDRVDLAVLGRGAGTQVEQLTQGRVQLRIGIPDGRLSSEHARLVRAGDDWIIEDRGSKNGTYVRGQQVLRCLLRDGDVIEAGQTFFVFRNTAAVRLEADGEDMVSTQLRSLEPGFEAALSALPRLARSQVPILLLGETGTGKEVAARTIHALSGRGGAFVAINCGALPDALVESELFGARRGAFSGALEDRPGLVRAAHGGSLFLDEIAELPVATQATLLRVLQEHEVTPIGDTRAIKVDLRVIAATHQDLEARVEAGLFRRDLYARLTGMQLRMPPLRARREDLGLLISRLLPRLGDRAESVRFSREAARALFAFDWPQNVRQLELTLAAAVSLAEGGEIRLAHLPPDLRGAHDQTDRPAPGPLSPADLALAQALRDRLEARGGNVTAVGRDFGKAPVQIRRWCKRLGIDLRRYRD